ncbi:MAG: hypothetical protein Q9163_003277 [Psora crenata]
MAYKRSRATFEADLQAQQSPYVVYGTPLPPLDSDTRDDGSYVPVWKQEVTDDQGRKRLHGAFTGGFSAGYFNTVGSKEGWTPSTFVSSRSNRSKDAIKPQQKPEDFMDEEDMAEAEEARKLQTTDSFVGLGAAPASASTNDPLVDLIRPAGETIGVKLMRRMGWREGQGVGPKVRRKARLQDSQEDLVEESQLFAPQNSKVITLNRKNDRKGLGYENGEGLAKPSRDMPEAPQDDRFHDHFTAGFASLTNNNKPKKERLERKGGFGVGILNDGASDDEDPYTMGPQISYNHVTGADKKKKKKIQANMRSANPLINSKPVFISKKSSASKASAGFRRCQDGRLPIDGFILPASPDLLSSTLSEDNNYPPPSIPAGWKSSKGSSNTKSVDPARYLSPAETATASKLSPKSRAALLGESQLPGKSVFDYLTPNARSRIVLATNNNKLPPALSEAEISSHPSQSRTLQSLVPPLTRENALAALGRGTAGWMPYAEDPAKRARYRSFLEVRASLRPEGAIPDRAPGVSNDDWVNEMNEFAHAAQIFKPMTGMMATRFTSSSSAPKLASDNPELENIADADGKPQLLSKPTEKTKTPAEEAATLSMYGPLTRSVEQFSPTHLLCKRFNVRPPTHVQPNPGDASVDSNDGVPAPPPTYSAALPQKRLELVGRKDMDDLKLTSGGKRAVQLHSNSMEQDDSSGIKQEDEAEEMFVVDPERNEALEKERPGEAIFKAIFGSDSEDD